MSILTTKEWRLVSSRHPLVESELKILRDRIVELESRVSKAMIEIDSLGKSSSPEEDEVRRGKVSAARVEVMKPKVSTGQEPELSSGEKLIHPIVRNNNDPDKDANSNRVVYCSLHYSDKDKLYIYRDANGTDLAWRFARTGVVVELMNLNGATLSPCPWCGVHNGKTYGSVPPLPNDKFVGH
jgi:hypothetical protein